MPVSKEWTEWHLTPGGWVSGSTRRTGAGNTWSDEPEDRVITFVYQQQVNNAHPEGRATVQESTQESWRSKTATNIDSLLGAHGPCPQKL